MKKTQKNTLKEVAMEIVSTLASRVPVEWVKEVTSVNVIPVELRIAGILKYVEIVLVNSPTPVVAVSL